MKNNHRRITAAALTIALGFSAAGATAFAPIASAQISAGQASSVNLDADVSLTVEKYAANVQPGDQDPTGLPTIAGIQFKIQKVQGLDLSTQAGWTTVSTLNAAGTSSLALSDITTLTTGADGRATISTADNSNFGVGVYLVTELQTAGYSVADPFFVTLPFTDPASGVWQYDQVVQPKNQAEDINIEKDVEDLGATLGEEITYTISAPLPAGNLAALSIIDDLPVELAAASNVKIYTGTSAANRAEYVLQDGEIVTTGGDGNQLTVTFGANDRASLQSYFEANPGALIFVEFDTTVVSLPGDGVIENHASINLGGDLRYSTDPTDPDGPDEPGTGTETRLGQLTINKMNDENALITADSASFELWRCQVDGEGKYNVIGSALSAVPTAGGTESRTSFTTVDGQATLYGVQVIDWVNNAAPDATIGEDLCVVETEAPAGYVINPEPQKVNFDLNTPDEFDMVVDVINLDDTIDGQLPSTGGMGTMAMIAAGLLVAVAGGFAALRGNRARG